MLSDRFEQEYYATVYQGLPVPEIECLDDIAILREQRQQTVPVFPSNDLDKNIVN